MANEPISALTLFTSYSTADEVEILDVSDTTFASTGTNKRIPFSTLLSMAGVGTTAALAPSSLMGNPTGSSAAPSAITLGANLSFSGTTLVATAGGGMTNPMTTAGDMIVGGSSGTPTRLAVGGTAGQVLTVVSGAPAWKTPPAATVANAILASQYTCTATMANAGLSVVLPSAGTYFLMANVRASLTVNNSTSASAWISGQFYDSTNSLVVPKSLSLLIFAQNQVTGVAVTQQTCAPIGPVIYTVTGSTTIQLQTEYTNAGSTITAANIPSDSNGYTSMTAMRIY